MSVRLGTIETTLSDLVEKCLVADLEQACCLSAIPSDSLEDFLDGCRLRCHRCLLRDLLQAEILSGPRRRRPGLPGSEERRRRRHALRLLGPERDFFLNEQ